MKKTISILTLGAVSIAIGSNASALSYSDNVGVNFTFDQSLTVSLSNASGGSSADLVINGLAPGSSSDSNIIDINVLSNNLSGYTLSSTVGDSTHTNPSYDNTNLPHTSNSSNTFTSLSTSDSISSLDDFNDNTWGYSYSLDNSTWSNYSGLPLYDTTGVALKTSTTPSAESGDTIKFKIAAKASTSQPSGEYRNVINFTVTAEHNPVSFYDAFKEAATQPGSTITTLNGYYKMQDMTADICNSIYTSQLDDNTDTMEAQLIDIRDNNTYWVAKLKDGHCWMTQNLDLDLSQFDTLTSNDTDLTTITDPNGDVFDDYTKGNGIITWTLGETLASSATISEFNIGHTADVMTGWVGTDTLPAQAEGGNHYVYASGTSADDIPYDSVASCAAASSNVGACSHYSIGNYYNWSAGVAANDTTKYAENYTVMPNSICPSSWRLPDGLTSEAGKVSPSDFNRLLIAQGIVDKEDTAGAYINYAGDGFAAIRRSPLYYVRPGNVYRARMDNYGRIGYYLTSTVANDSGAYMLGVYANSVGPSAPQSRIQGRSVRCLAR